jgi:hypothetical protein
MLFRSESLVPLMVIDVSPPPLSIVGSRRPAPSPTWGLGTTFPSTTVHAHDMPMSHDGPERAAAERASQQKSGPLKRYDTGFHANFAFSGT